MFIQSNFANVNWNKMNFRTQLVKIRQIFMVFVFLTSLVGANPNPVMADSPAGFLEDFESGWTSGSDIVNTDWYSSGTPTVVDNYGVGGTWGLSNSPSIFTWMAHPFQWTDPALSGVLLGMDFQTDSTGTLDDDRVGWMIEGNSTNSDLIFGIQVDPGTGGSNIQGYWDEEINVNENKRPSIADVALLGNTWYRLRAEFTKLTDASAQIDVELWMLDSSGAPDTLVASGSIADTSALPEDDRPDVNYFAGTLYPAYKNHAGPAGNADNAYFEILTAPAVEYTLTVTDDGNGSVTLDPPDGIYDEGTTVTLTADPNPGYLFDNWSGDLTGSNNPENILIDANKTVAASFVVDPTPPINTGDVIISGFQAWGAPEFVSIFNTTDQIISLENLDLISRVDPDGSGATGVSIDWQLPDGLLSGATIAPHSFFLIAESAVAGAEPDLTTTLDLATGEGGFEERALGIELVIDSVHMDYVLYGRDTGSDGDNPDGDIPFDGSSWPRIEVIRNTRETASFQEGVIYRLSAFDLYAGYDVAGYYTDEGSLGDGYPNGVWTSPHDDTDTSYQARNSTSAAVLPPAPPVCYALTLGHSGNGATPTASPLNSSGCPANEYVSGETISLSGASADSGWQIEVWYGTDNNSSTADFNSLTMPASSHAAGVDYVESAPTSMICEDFESGWADHTAIDNADWYSNNGLLVEDDFGIGGTWGLDNSGNIFTWMGQPFNWDAAETTEFVVQMDFQTSESGEFDDDRIGWMIEPNSTNSDLIFGVQLDNANGHLRMEGYWDNIINVNENIRVEMADLDNVSLDNDAWYRLKAEITKLSATSARIDGELWSLDGSGNPISLVASGSIVDTSALAEAERPDAAYFAGTLWPGYKNHTGAAGNADNTCFEVITGTPPAQYALTVTDDGNGNVTLDPAGGTYYEGTSVQLTATPNIGYSFFEWDGDLSGSTNPGTITMDGNKTVTAAFVAVPPVDLTITIEGNGSVALDPLGGTYDVGTDVELTATPDADWYFTGWSGALSGIVNPTSIIMDSAKDVTATFVEIPVQPAGTCEDFEDGFALDQAVGTHAEWFDSGTGAVVTAGEGLAGSIGLAPGSSIFTWTQHPFDWNDPAFTSIKFSMDFRSNESGYFDDDRVGWMVADDDASSANLFGVQLDTVVDGDGGIVTYWRNSSGTRIQTLIVPLEAVSAETWYRLEATITKLTDTSASIDVSLVELDALGDPTGISYSGTVDDTSIWPDGTPDLSYFTADTMWPAYKNHNAIPGAADNACFDLVSGRFAFVVSSDWHTSDDDPNNDIAAKIAQIANWVDNPTSSMPAPEFIVITGDFPHLAQTEAIIDAEIDPDFPWYPVMGNHELDDITNDFSVIRDIKVPSLPNIVDYGPDGSVNSTYSWSYENAHFVAINAYWDGNTTTGSDTAADGDVVPALNTWVGNDLATNGQTHNFAFMHEPLYPAHRHVGDSLDAHPVNRDALVATLNTYGTETIFHGHTHYYEHDVTPEFPLGNLHQVTNGSLRSGGVPVTVTYVLVEGSITTYKVYSWTGSTFALYDQWTIGGSEPPPTCYALNLTHTGNGTTPTASPANSTGCGAGEYLAGEAISLSDATPDSGWQIESWTGTDNNGSNANINTVTMPASAHTAGVNYILSGPTTLTCESFNTYTAGGTIGTYPEWFDSGAGPVVTDGNGVAGTVGLTNSGSIFTWTAHPFDWNAVDFAGINLQADFQTDGSGYFDDDRIGWMITDSSTNSDNIFGVQLDPGGSGYNIEAYWDGDSFGDNGGRTSIANLPTLSPNAWYRLRAEITKLTATSVQINAILTALDASGNPGAIVASGTLADTDLVLGTAENEVPNPAYFTGPIWPAYKNHTGVDGAFDNPCYEVVTGEPPEQFDLTVNIIGNGTVSPNPVGGTYYAGTTVQLTANPDPGFAFGGWTGDLISITNPESIIIDSDKTVTVTFVESNEATVTFQNGLSGYTGTVDTHIMEAEPTADYSALESVEWDNDDPLGTGQYKYALIRFDDIFGSGLGQIPLGAIIQSATLYYEVFNIGDPADINEIAVDWIESESWNSFGGDAGVQGDEYGASLGSATGDTLSLRSVDVTTSLAAWSSNPSANRGWIFRPTDTDGVDFRSSEYATVSSRPSLEVTYLTIGSGEQYNLTINTDDSGSVSLNPAGGLYPAGMLVQLTAEPAIGYAFSNWSGDLIDTASPAYIVMDVDKTVTATFSELPPVTLTVNTVGQGSVSLDPSGGLYPPGTSVSLTAIPSPGWYFGGWSGDLSGMDNPISITMDTAKTVTADFTQIPLDVDYYVDNTNISCSNTGPGTLATPLCTISRGAELAVAGETVYVVDGTYVETVFAERSGTEGNPITFRAGPGVTVTGDPLGFGSAFAMGSKSYIVIDGFNITQTMYIGIYVADSDHITLSNNHVSYAGLNAGPSNHMQGIVLRETTYSTIIGNTTNHNSCIGIRLVNNSDYNTISNNISFGNSSAIAYPVVAVSDAAGISVEASSNNTIINNIVYGNEDSGINIYVGSGTVPLPSSHNLIVGNLSYGNGDHGIDHNNSPYNTLIGNTVHGNGTVGINFEGDATPGSNYATVINNISVGNGFTPPEGSFGGNLRVDSASIEGTILDYNIFDRQDASVQIIWDNDDYISLTAFQAAVPGQEVHGVEGDPLFVAPAPSVLRTNDTSYVIDVNVGDYYLNAGSPAIDSANSDAPSQPLTDIVGNARVDDPATPDTGVGTRTYDDRGAYEFLPLGQSLPVLTTQALTEITTETATGNGTITATGEPNPIQHGVVWNTTGAPTTVDSKTEDGAVSSTGAFTSSLTGLTPGTLYYVRTYATNAVGTVYGEEVSFTTHQVPAISTQAVTDITIDTARGNGNITALGVPNPTEHGVVWSIAENPTTDDDKTTDGLVSTTGTFISEMTGLTPGTLYHVRAYATNAAGTVYGEDVTFTTSLEASVTTQPVTEITTTTATGNGTLTALGIPDPTQHGVVWSINPAPTIADDKTTDGAASATGAFTSAMTDLTPGTLYHVRAYATNAAGTVYGEEVTFTSLLAPTVITQPVDGIMTTSANGNGNITDLGTFNPTEHGVVWSTTENPTIENDNKTTDGPVSVIGTFTSAITGLTPGTLYHIRAYATSAAGTSYGDDIIFTTHVEPTVITAPASSIGTTTAVGNGNITILGEPHPTQHGVVWSTSPNPTISDNKTVDGDVIASGTFTSSITGLTPGMLYHIRAYATNFVGTVYGEDITFTTLPSTTGTTTPTVDAGTGANITEAGLANWANPGYITADDTNYASTTLVGNVLTSSYLEGTDFGFSIPSNASIEGITVTIGRHASGAIAGSFDVRDSVVSLLRAGTLTGDNKAATGTEWPTGSPVPAVYGTAADLWGTTWTPADINDPNFGVALSVISDINRIAYVDYMQIAVTYTVTVVGSHTTVDCGAGTPLVTYGSDITCVATVTRGSGDKTPSGSVSWATDGSGTFVTSPCTLSGTDGTSSCSAIYTPSSVGSGSHLITATYAGDASFFSSVGSQTIAVEQPWFSTFPENDWVEGHGWPLGAPVTLTVNGTDYSDTQTVVEAPWNPTEETYVEFDLAPYDLVPDDVVVLTDGAAPKDHTVTNVAITDVDQSLDTVTGTADLGTGVGVRICDDSSCIHRFVTADIITGVWLADFSIPGPEPMEGDIYDIQAGINIAAFQNDDDFDDTTVFWDIPLPSFSARFPNGEVHGYEWPLGVDVTISIDDPDNGPGEDYTDTQPVIVAPWDPSTTGVVFPLDGFTLEPGQIITMTDDLTVKEHTATDVSITAVDSSLEIVEGTASPSTNVYVDICNDSGCDFQDVTADGGGIWSVAFTDIQAGDNISAIQDDDDQDHTAYEWHVPNPFFDTRPTEDRVEGYEWPVGTMVNLNINDGGYLASAEVVVADWDPNQTYVEFDLSGSYDLVPGDLVVLSGAGITKDHVVTNLTVTSMNAGTNIISGTTTAPFDVDVWAHADPENSHQIVTPVTGAWDADLSPYDLSLGEDGAAVQYDNDGDATWIDWRIPNPVFEARPDDDLVEGFEWPLGATITLEVDGVAHTPSMIVGPAPWDSSQTYVAFNLNGLHDLAPGQFVTMTDGTTLKEHTVTELIVLGTDDFLNTVYGTTNAPMDVDVWVHDDYEGSHTSALPVGVNWTVDLSPYDLVPGENGAAAQYDDDGDGTWIEWQVPNPRFDTHPVDDRIEGFDWPIGTSVNLNINNGEHTDSGVVGVAPWDSNQTYVEFDLSGAHDLLPGDEIVLTDGVTTKEHVVTDLTVISMDDVLNIVSGTTTAPFDVEVWAHADSENSHQAVTPVAGVWDADLSPYDLSLGEDGAAVQYDDDGDTTWVDWHVPNLGIIIIEKQTDPDGATESFEFSTDYGANFTLFDDETNNSGPLSAGIYSVSEINIPADWSLTSATCSDGSDPSMIDLNEGETVTCTFTNTYTVLIHSISLVAGWNLISFSVHPENTDIATVLSSIDGNFDLVYGWDATGAHSSSGNWLKYDPAALPFLNSLTDLDERMGFWIHMTSADTLDVVGSAPTFTDIQLLDNAGGWNLVAYPSIAGRSLPGVLQDHGVGTDFSLVYAYDANDINDPWKLFDRTALPFLNDLTELLPGWGYWINVSADNTWDVQFQAD